MVTRDKLIFPSTITLILCHFSIPFPLSDHFSVMCAIDYATVKRSEAQFHSRRSGTTASPTPSAPSTSAPSILARGVTLNAILTQFQHMDACLDTLSTKLYQVNTYVSCIAKQQARLSGCVESPSPSFVAPEASEDDDVSNDVDNGEDGDASSFNSNEMST